MVIIWQLKFNACASHRELQCLQYVHARVDTCVLSLHTCLLHSVFFDLWLRFRKTNNTGTAMSRVTIATAATPEPTAISALSWLKSLPVAFKAPKSNST